MGFLDALAWPRAERYWIRRARVPGCLLGAVPRDADFDRDGAVLADILIDGERIGLVEPWRADAPREAASVDLAGRHAWPALVDMHTHLDKGHVVARTENPDGSFAGARDASVIERERYWRFDDVHRRMEFGLRCAYAHGVACIRTHLDSMESAAETSWSVFRTLRAEWQERIALQGVSIVPLDAYRTPYAERLADLVAASGGVLGVVTRAATGLHGAVLSDIDLLLDRLFRLAADRGLDVDLHVDESGDPEAAALPRVAAAVLRTKFRGRVVCGHCCSLAVQPEDEARRTLALCAEAGLAIVTLPTVNLYLQDRTPSRTPRWRGVTLIKEMRAAGIEVAIGGDNVRDPFYAYGDHDMVDTLRAAIRIAHLDHPIGDVPAMAGPIPAAIIGAGPLCSIAPGAPARLVLFAARSLNELVCRPQSDRIIMDRGRRITVAVPEYSELDDS